MDKHILEKYKIIIKKMCMIFLIVLLGVFLIGIVNKNMAFFDAFAGLFFCIISIYLLGGLIYVIIFYGRKKIFESKAKGYNYEPPYNYSPAIASFLLDEDIDFYQEFEAIKLNLLIKGYIKKNKNNKYISTDKKPDALLWHEYCVYKEIIAENPKNKSEMDKKYFKYSLENDLKKLKLLKDEESDDKRDEYRKGIISIGVAFLTGFIIVLTACTVATWEDNIERMLLPLIVMIILDVAGIVTLIKKSKKRTELGKKHSNEWKKFKNYLEDYTLINEKDEEHYKLLGEYIPYAMSLGVAEKIKRKFLDEEKKVYKNKSYFENIIDFLEEM